jgi:hypothetical protein
MIPNKNKKKVSAQPKKQKKRLFKQAIANLSSASKKVAQVPSTSLSESVGNIGGRVGKYLGEKVAGLFSTLTGVGDYSINSNSLTSGTPVPSFRNNKRCTIVSHREYLGDIVTGALVGSYSTFNIQSFVLNPGLVTSFPWLSDVASNFSQYRFHGMVFEFKSTCGSAVSATNNALGTVIMATDYNANNVTFVSKQQMEDYEFADSCKPSDSFLHPIECAPAEQASPLYYVRSGPLLVGDYRLSDLGIFQIATQGMQAANINIGELWVTYEIELYKPLIPISLSDFSGQFAHIRGTGYTNTATFGTSFTLTGNLGPNVGLANTSNKYDTIVLPLISPSTVAYFFVHIIWFGTSTAQTIVGPSFPNSSNITCAKVNLMNGNTAGDVTSGGTFNYAFYTGIFECSAALLQCSAGLKFSSETLPAAGNQFCDIFIYGLPGNGVI